MNSKKNSKIGDLAENVSVAIVQEKCINQDIHNVKGVVSSNIAMRRYGCSWRVGYVRASRTWMRMSF